MHQCTRGGEGGALLELIKRHSGRQEKRTRSGWGGGKTLVTKPTVSHGLTLAWCYKKLCHVAKNSLFPKHSCGNQLLYRCFMQEKNKTKKTSQNSEIPGRSSAARKGTAGWKVTQTAATLAACWGRCVIFINGFHDCSLRCDVAAKSCLKTNDRLNVPNRRFLAGGL